MLRLTAAFMLLVSSAWADSLVILTLDDPRDDHAPLTFSLDDLDNMTQTEVNTTNEFVDGLNSFEGPLMRDLLEQIGIAPEHNLRLVALNAYEAAMPASDAFNYDVILATRMNGNILSRRTKGPIWVIYPMSNNPELQDARHNAKLIWQLETIEVQ